jgi:hypothetical protein
MRAPPQGRLTAPSLFPHRALARRARSTLPRARGLVGRSAVDHLGAKKTAIESRISTIPPREERGTAPPFRTKKGGEAMKTKTKIKAGGGINAI